MLALTSLLFDVVLLSTLAFAGSELELPDTCPGPEEWNYDQEGRDWGSKCKAWEICGTGQMQSPIDLPADEFATTHKPVFDFPDGTVEGVLFNRGVGLEWSPGKGSHHLATVQGVCGQIPLHPETVDVPTLSFENYTYNFLQWHLHTPTSEHSYGGVKRAAEIHFVFGETSPSTSGPIGKDVVASGSGPIPRAVVGIGIIEADDTDPFFAQILPRGITFPGPGNHTQIPVSLDFRNILDADHMDQYWTYRGSLTTPPCTEGLRWFLGAGNATLSGLVDDYQKVLGAGSTSDRAIQETTAQHQVNM